MGRNSYTNNDAYIGLWKDNLKDGHGIYIHSPLPNEGTETTKLLELYSGLWKEGARFDKGICVWRTYVEGQGFDESKFDTFIGKMQNDLYKFGLYITKDKGKFFIYYGYFDAQAKKTDPDAYYCQFSDHETEQHFIGEMIEDQIKSGHIIVTKGMEPQNIIEISIGENGESITKAVEDEGKKQDLVKKVHEYSERFMVDPNLANSVFDLSNKCIELPSSVKSLSVLDNEGDDNRYTKILDKITDYNTLIKRVIPSDWKDTRPEIHSQSNKVPEEIHTNTHDKRTDSQEEERPAVNAIIHSDDIATDKPKTIEDDKIVEHHRQETEPKSQVNEDNNRSIDENTNVEEKITDVQPNNENEHPEVTETKEPETGINEVSPAENIEAVAEPEKSVDEQNITKETIATQEETEGETNSTEATQESQQSASSGGGKKKKRNKK